MGTQEELFFEKKGIPKDKVMYFTRSGRNTVIHIEGQSAVETFHPMKRLLECFEDDAFVIVNKGIAISPRYIQEVKDDTYIMKDEAEFKGRVRTSKADYQNVLMSRERAQAQEWNQFNLLDNMPMAFCIIELLFDEQGHSIDFVFRYCNKEMERLEGRSVDDMINKSFYDVFKNGDKKWLITYADVAVNGTTHVIESYSPEIDSNLKIYCYQPKPNFCACALTRV